MDDDCAKHMFQIHYGAWLAVYRQMFVTCKALMNPALQIVKDNSNQSLNAKLPQSCEVSLKVIGQSVQVSIFVHT